MRKANIASLLFFAAFFAFAIYSISDCTPDPDLWGHLKFGLDALTSKSLPATDVYSYTAYGLPWIVNHEIAFDVLLGLIYKSLGTPGIVVLHAASLIVFLMLYLTLAKSRADIFLKALFSWLAISVISYGLALRPQLFSFLFYAILLLVLNGGNRRLRWLLPLIFLPWASFHGGFFIGLAVMYIYFFVEAVSALIWDKASFNSLARQSALVGAISLLATFVNPYGAKMHAFIMETVMWDRLYIPEWWPINILDGSFPDYKVLFLVFIAALLVARRIYSWPLFIISLSVLAAGFRHNRHIPFAAITLCFFLSPYLETISSKIGSLVSGKTLGRNGVRFGLLAALTAAVLCSIPLLRKESAFRVVVPTSKYPVEAVAFMKSKNITGNCACFFDWGEYLIWHLGGRVKVSLDGRIDSVYPKSVIKENFDFIYAHKEGLKLLRDHPTDIVLIHRGNPVAGTVSALPGWRLVFQTDIALLYMKTEKADKLGLAASKGCGCSTKTFTPFP